MYLRPTSLSEKGAAFIAGFEGAVLRPYNDPLGYATIGFGHLIGKRRVTLEDRQEYAHFTKADAMQLLRRDAFFASQTVHQHVKPKINQPQHDALTSFVFNVGPSQFLTSSLLRKLNTHPGTDEGIVGKKALNELHTELLRWVNKGTLAEAGLRRRREAEFHLFEEGRYA